MLALLLYLHVVTKKGILIHQVCPGHMRRPTSCVTLVSMVEVAIVLPCLCIKLCMRTQEVGLRKLFDCWLTPCDDKTQDSYTTKHEHSTRWQQCDNGVTTSCSVSNNLYRQASSCGTIPREFWSWCKESRNSLLHSMISFALLCQLSNVMDGWNVILHGSNDQVGEPGAFCIPFSRIVLVQT